MQEMLRQANNHIVRCCSITYPCATIPGVSPRQLAYAAEQVGLIVLEQS